MLAAPKTYAVCLQNIGVGIPRALWLYGPECFCRQAFQKKNEKQARRPCNLLGAFFLGSAKNLDLCTSPLGYPGTRRVWNIRVPFMDSVTLAGTLQRPKMARLFTQDPSVGRFQQWQHQVPGYAGTRYSGIGYQ
eukprot:1346786-Rhodomonas_salina.1